MVAIANPEPVKVVATEKSALTLVPEPAPTVPSPEAAEAEAPEGVRRAERTMWRSAAIGVAIGIPACALIWMGIAALAVAIAGFHVSSWPGLLAMAATVGAFAGCFFGGWAGVTVSAEQLERAERVADTHHA